MKWRNRTLSKKEHPFCKNINEKNPVETFKTVSAGFFYVVHSVNFSVLSSDTAKHDTKDQHQKAYRNIKIFTHRIKIFCEWFFTALVDLALYIVPAKYPEEHDSCKSCAKRADIDRKYIHPVRDDALDQKRNYDSDSCDHHTGRDTAKACFFLNRGDGGLIKVHKGSHACKENGYEERDAILAHLRGLDDRRYTVLGCEWLNRKNDPPLPIFIWKE